MIMDENGLLGGSGVVEHMVLAGAILTAVVVDV
jgi:hypothetical protein